MVMTASDISKITKTQGFSGLCMTCLISCHYKTVKCDNFFYAKDTVQISVLHVVLYTVVLNCHTDLVHEEVKQGSLQALYSFSLP